MRYLALTIIAAAVLGGCTAMRYHGDPDGPVLTIQNESGILLDLAYRCTENGPVRRLGAVPPRMSDTFPLQPADCTTLHLVHQPLGIGRPDARPFAVVPLFDQSSVELVLNEQGVVMRR
jgi:hypothetical protein